ncbi:MAG: DNA translocase FtsK 4TM domain-containing protein [Bacteroidaceae bacterium]|nr:DNA translocase FtsK 4TM domain-containing protein [Bacteroidaceae bacterium]
MAKRKTANNTSSSIRQNPITVIKSETFSFIIGMLLLGTSIFLLFAFTSFLAHGGHDQSITEDFRIDDAVNAKNEVENSNGSLGAIAAATLMNNGFGFAAYVIPLFLIVVSLKLMKAYLFTLWKWFISCTVIMGWSSVVLSFLFNHTPLDMLFEKSHLMPGGEHGNFVVDRCLIPTIGVPGLIIAVVIIALLYFIFVWSETMVLIRKALNPKKLFQKIKFEVKTGKDTNEPSYEESLMTEDEYTSPREDETTIVDFDNIKEDEGSPTIETVETGSRSEDALSGENPQQNGDIEMTIDETIEEEKADGKTLAPYDPKLDLEKYRYPTINLLKQYQDDTPLVDMKEQNANKERIITVLRNFGVEISSIKATVGPTITLYEITPAVGVRIAKIRNLEDDIALSLSALGIRIIAPIPGKGTIGIEVPNANPRIVSMESIINSKKFQDSTYELPIALGKTITNEVFMVDLAKMPHILVAGATGQGKSVGLNAIITSLLYKKHPAELKFVMVDPKKVEFSVYSPLERHFLAKVPDEGEDPIITDVQKVIRTLKSLCAEMDARYDLLKKAKVRNIKEYNEKFKNRTLNPENGHRFLPYIVVIIDEFGDLIMTAGKEIELPIARIAQLARAIGIHMVIATQRPTTNIITGTIKANFPARIAFRVGAMIDSRTILDRPGANQLIGRGDMLFLNGSDPTRVQCAFIDTPEVERINSFISEQRGYLSAFELPEVIETDDNGIGSDGTDFGKLDPMFKDAARHVVQTQQGSTSMIQRKFSIGYNRAGRIMDQLEQMGIVGAAHGSKPREVLIKDEVTLENALTQIED